MRHHLKKQHECSYLLLFSFQSNNLFSFGEIFTAANFSLLCHVFVIHRGRLPRSIGLRIPPHEESYFEFCVSTPPSVGRCASVLSPKPSTRFTPVCLKTYLLSPPSLLTSHPLTLTLIQAISSIWRVR